MDSQEEIDIIPSDEEGQSVNENIARKPRKKRKHSSIVWKHFKAVQMGGNQKGKCNHCGKLICANDGTSTMKRHIGICNSNPANIEDQKNLFMKKTTDGTGGNSGTLKTWKYDPAKVRKALVKMIVVDKLPFSFVEHEGFKEFMETICPSFNVPSRFTIARDVSDYYLEEKKKLKEYFVKSKQKVCLTTDTWTSIQQINYMVLTSHFIDENWTYHKRIINFRPILSHTGDAIGRAIEACLNEWGIEHVMTITMDNASSNDVAVKSLQSSLPNLFCGGKYLHVRCLAHIINLIVKDGLSQHDKTIERVRNAVRYIKKSPGRLNKFKGFAKEKSIESKALLSLDVSTRWNNTHDMLERAVKFEKAFELYGKRDKGYRNDLVEVPGQTDWMYATKMVELLGLFKRKTEKFSCSTYVIANQFFCEVMDVSDFLDKLLNEKGQVHDFMEMASLMRNKFEKYFGDEGRKNMLLEFAVILDPRMKLHIIQFSSERLCMLLRKETDKYNENKVTDEDFKKMVETVVDGVKSEMQSLFKEYEVLYGTGTVNPPETNNNSEQFRVGENSFLDAFQQYRGGGVHSFGQKTELEKYLKDGIEENSSSFDILSWWKQNSSRYPILSKMAKDILAIPVSTVASESAFSTGGRVVDSYRSSLSPPIIEALICTQDWVRKSSKEINKSDDFDKLEDLAQDIVEQMGLVMIDE